MPTLGPLLVQSVYAVDVKSEVETKLNETVEQWKNDVYSLWARYGQPGSQVNFGSETTDDGLPRSQNDKDGKPSMSDWLFVTWSTDNLRKLLKDNSIKFNSKDDKYALINTVRKNYDTIEKNIQKSNSDRVPPQEIFKNWSIDDLVEWMKLHKIKINDDIVGKRDKLLNAVRDQIYQTSHAVEKQRYKVLQGLDFANKKLVDKNNKISGESFSDFSKDDLQQWLLSHEIHLDKSLSDSKDYLLKQAKGNTKLLQDDIEWFLEKSKEQSTPFLSKSSEYMHSVWDSMSGYISAGKEQKDKYFNEDTLSNINDWSDEKLKDFLDSINMDYPKGASKEELFKLMKQNAMESLGSAKEKEADTSTVDDIKEWALKRSKEIKGSEAYHKIGHKINDINKDVNAMTHDLNKQMDQIFMSWSTDDLVNYLKSVNLPFEEPHDKKSLIERAKAYTSKMLGYVPEPAYVRYARRAHRYARTIYNMVMHRYQ